MTSKSFKKISTWFLNAMKGHKRIKTIARFNNKKSLKGKTRFQTQIKKALFFLRLFQLYKNKISLKKNLFFLQVFLKILIGILFFNKRKSKKKRLKVIKKKLLKRKKIELKKMSSISLISKFKYKSIITKKRKHKKKKSVKKKIKRFLKKKKNLLLKRAKKVIKNNNTIINKNKTKFIYNNSKLSPVSNSSKKIRNKNLYNKKPIKKKGKSIKKPKYNYKHKYRKNKKQKILGFLRKNTPTKKTNLFRKIVILFLSFICFYKI